MKKLFFILSLQTIAILGVVGQQVPLYTQYFEDPMIYNPAKTGWDGRYNLNFIYRREFTGFQNGPETRALTFDMPIMTNKAGIGMYIYDDATSIFHRTAGYASYAYHINFSDENRLSFGLSAGVEDVKIDLAQATVSDPTDPLIANGRANNTFFDGNFGANYYWHGLNVGFSIQQLLGTDMHYLSDPGVEGYSPRRTYNVPISYDLKLFRDSTTKKALLTISPLAMFRTTEALDWGLDAGVKVMFKDWIWVSGMYRYNYGATAGIGVKIHDLVKIGYSYDAPLNQLKAYTNGNHEITIGITIPHRKKEGLDSSLIKQISRHDSLINNLVKRVDTISIRLDSLSKKTDSLGRETDSLGRKTDSLGRKEDINIRKTEQMNNRLDSLSAFVGMDETTPSNGIDTTGASGRKGRWKGGNGNENFAGTDKMTQKQIDELRKRLDDLEAKYGKALEEGGAGGRKSKKGKKEDLNEMQEERTRVVDEKDLEYKHGAPLGNYFMVVGSFRIEQNSYNFEGQLNKENFKAGTVYDKKRKWYYVYLSKPESKEKGLEELYKLREENPRFHDAWIHIMSKAVR